MHWKLENASRNKLVVLIRESLCFALSNNPVDLFFQVHMGLLKYFCTFETTSLGVSTASGVSFMNWKYFDLFGGGSLCFSCWSWFSSVGLVEDNAWTFSMTNCFKPSASSFVLHHASFHLGSSAAACLKTSSSSYRLRRLSIDALSVATKLMLTYTLIM